MHNVSAVAVIGGWRQNNTHVLRFTESALYAASKTKRMGLPGVSKKCLKNRMKYYERGNHEQR